MDKSGLAARKYLDNRVSRCEYKDSDKRSALALEGGYTEPAETSANVYVEDHS
jgi:hypothetical protein